MTRYLTPAEYAAASGLSESLVRAMTRDGRLRRSDCRCIHIPEDAQ